MMKKFTLLLTAVVASFALSAQTFVDTTAKLKNVVLEEYTGIHCTYCPDGHKRANALDAANPGRVVLINIHTGSYARPGAGEPDFRTTEGDAIAAHPDVKISGYPAGSTNRRPFANSQKGGTASSRSNWATDASVVLAESSPVNVDLKATYDNVKGEMVVVVEAFYTATVTKTHNLTVGVTEDKVKGPQTGATSFYPEMINPDGTYNHNHMLRDILNGTWGEVMPATTKGTFFTKTYTWKIPADIKGVPVNAVNLGAFAFIAEGQQNAITGAFKDIELPTSIKTDLEVTSKVVAPTGSMCNGEFTPSFEVENKFSNAITSFKMSYSINGGAPVVKTFSGNLTQGQKTTLTWPKVNLPTGAVSKVTYRRPYDISGGFIDVNDGSIAPGEYTVVAKNAINADASENFSNATLTSMPSNWIPYAQGKLDGRIYISDKVGNTTSAKGKGFWVSLSWGNVGDKAGLLIGEIDMTGKKGLTVDFNHAHAELNGGENDKLALLISTDCGLKWEEKWSKSGSELNAFATNKSQVQCPGNNSDWNSDTVAFDVDAAGVLVKLEVTTGKGNSMWLDDISIKLNDKAVSVGDLAKSSTGFTVYPNPAKNVVNLEIENWSADANVTITDVVGKVVYNKTLSNTTSTIDVSDFNKGVYSVSVSVENEMYNSKLIVE